MTMPFVSWCVRAKSLQLCLTLCNPMGCYPWGSPDQNTAVGYHALLWYLPDPGIQPVSLASPALVGVSLPTSTTWEDRNPVKLILCVR